MKKGILALIILFISIQIHAQNEVESIEIIELNQNNSKNNGIIGEYSALSVCPTVLTLSADNTIICTADTVELYAELDDGEAAVQWFDPFGNPTNGASFILNNPNCQPAIFNFTAVAVCVEDPSVTLTESISITVYPTDISTFLTAAGGGCNVTATVSPICGEFVTAIPQTFNDGESGIANIQIIYQNNPSCLINNTFPVAFNCSSTISCPNILIAGVDDNSVCSGDVVNLSAGVDQGFVEYEWFNIQGNPINSTTFGLENTNCLPGTAQFIAVATCLDDPTVVLTDTVIIEVFPSDISAYLTPSVGGCIATLDVSPACGNAVTVTSQTFMPGTSGTANLLVDYNQGDCIDFFIVPVEYDCPESAVCLTSLNTSAIPSAICSGDEIDLIATPNQGNANIQWTDPNGNEIEPNNWSLLYGGCTPATTTFTVTAVCTDNPSITISEDVSITVYPTDVSSFIEVSASVCSPNIQIASSCTAYLTYENSTFNPGTSGTADINFTYNGIGCIEDFTLPVNYNCPAEIFCPSTFQLNANATEYCDGDIAQLNFTIDAGEVNIIWVDENGQTFNPNAIALTNNTCQVESHTYTAFAVCDGNPNITFTESITLQVYPTNISSFLTPTDQGGCNPSIIVDPACGNTVQFEVQSVNAGESGTAFIAVESVNNPCISNLVVEVDYDCPMGMVDCPSQLTAAASVEEVCSGSTIQLTAVVDNFDATYTWTNSMGAVIDPNGVAVVNNACSAIAMTFSVLATCTADNSVQLNQNVSVIVYPDVNTIGDFLTPVIDNCSISLAADASCGNNLDIGVVDVTPGSSGTANIPITYINGPTCLDGLSVNAQYNINQIELDDLFLCEPGNVQFQGLPSISCTWSPTIGLSNPNICDPLINVNNDITYVISIIESNGCAYDVPFNIGLGELNVIANYDENTGLICVNANVGDLIEITPTNGLPNPPVFDEECIAANPTVTTTYTITVTNTDGCVGTDEVTIVVGGMNEISVNLGDDLNLCTGDEINLQTQLNDVTCLWTTPLGNFNTCDLNISNPVSGTYALSVYDANGNTGSDEIEITFTDEVSHPVLNANQEICAGQTANFISSTPVIWGSGTATNTFDLTTENDTIIPVFIPGNSCQTFEISLNIADFVTGETITYNTCNDEPIQICASDNLAGISCSWLPQTGLDFNTICCPFATLTESTTYSVIITLEDNCQIENTIVVNVGESPKLTVPDDFEFCLDEIEPTVLSVTGTGTFVWESHPSLDATDPENVIITPTTSTTYFVLLVDSVGCVSSDSIYVEIKNCDPGTNDNLFFFNAITPNNDGRNDAWLINGIENYPNNTLKIFNRWGEELISYEPYQNANAWKGTNDSDEKLPDGTYYYMLDLNVDTIPNPLRTGTVTLIR